jgi:predicted nucleotidyltransferase
MNSISHQIRTELARIEQENGVRVLFAVESGSRAWGFASRDSDYDVRFVYAHACDWYLSVSEDRDVIEEPISDALDISGWDLRKALRLLRKSNPSLLEWLKSPVVYQADPAFALLFGLLASEYHSPGRLFQHYLHMAKGNWSAQSRGDRVRLKTYLYVLRPLLACRWIERGLGPVPMSFQVLTDGMLEDGNLRFHIAVLVARKRAGEELADAQRIPAIDAFIEAELARLEKLAPMEHADADNEKLDQFFREFCTAEAA